MEARNRMNYSTSGSDTRVASLWHTMPAADVLAELKTSADGLDAVEASRRLQVNGPNQLPSPPRAHPVLRFLAQFNNTLIWFLMAAAAVAGFLGHFVDAGVIVAVVVINAIVGFVQEGKAEQALAAIRDMIAPHATVLRGGKRHKIDAREIAIGDVVVVEAGDKTPADLRLIRARNVLADEAILTGESLPAVKGEATVELDAPLGDRVCMLYSGTLIATGQATGVVVTTGKDTEIGKIATLIGQVQTQTTPLLRQINQFGRLITWFAIGLAALLFAFAILLRGYQ